MFDKKYKIDDLYVVKFGFNKFIKCDNLTTGCWTRFIPIGYRIVAIKSNPDAILEKHILIDVLNNKQYRYYENLSIENDYCVKKSTAKNLRQLIKSPKLKYITKKILQEYLIELNKTKNDNNNFCKIAYDLCKLNRIKVSKKDLKQENMQENEQTM